MEIVANCLDRFDLNCRRQLRVQGTDQFFRGMLPIGIEVKALAVGMYAGIGAAAAMDLHGGGKDIAQRCFDVVLHRVAMRLALPTAEVCAVIGANTFPTHAKHCVGFAWVVKSEVWV
jgi:hypothetical protein